MARNNVPVEIPPALVEKAARDSARRERAAAKARSAKSHELGRAFWESVFRVRSAQEPIGGAFGAARFADAALAEWQERWGSET